ncbi:YceD family protein [Propionicicella superfundia]|uniref:YceD family protein n=1 Tax=Propionicicella superfundia TaxID=348582 RepID=UPI00048C846C|nr:YceD family protein [Propionicicella superfundia]
MSQRGLHARSDLVFEVHDLGRRVAGLSTVRRTAIAGEGIGNEMIGVPVGSPIDLDLRFESVVEGVLVTGAADVSLHGVCARCLKEIELVEQIDLMELFLYPDKELDDEEASRIEDETVDLEPVLRDAVVLDLPFTPLCREDCAGLCPTCGTDLNDDPDHGHGDAVDPRWAGLSGLMDD